MLWCCPLNITNKKDDFYKERESESGVGSNGCGGGVCVCKGTSDKTRQG